MGSMSNSNPWSPYDSYNDCSQGVCNIYCPQWCYLIFPPPPPPSFFLDDEDDSSSSSSFSPLLIALIGILLSAFILVSYYTLISKYCHHRRSSEASERDPGGVFSSSARQVNSNAAVGGGDGLNDSMIKSITVYKYRKGDGFVDGSDCSVCLSEFEEEESLRLLPKCNHAFHLPCIDTWLKSHSNCPLCRAFVTGINTPSSDVAHQSISIHPIASAESGDRGGRTAEISSTVSGYTHHTGDSVIVIEDLEVGSRNTDGRSESQVRSPAEEQRDAKDEEDRQPIRRSVSLNAGTVVSIADVLREIEDDVEEKEQVSAGVGTSQQRREGDGYCDGKTPPPPTSTEAETAANQRSGVSSFLVRSSVAMKRSVSTGRFSFSRYDRARNYSLPN